jgi:hypothetical protein
VIRYVNPIPFNLSLAINAQEELNNQAFGILHAVKIPIWFGLCFLQRNFQWRRKMRKSRTHCLSRRSLSKNLTSVLLLLATVMLAAGPALAVDFDVKDTNVTVGGYLKLMMIYDTDGYVDSSAHPFNGDLMGGYDPPLDGTSIANDDGRMEAEGEKFRMTGRESRLFVKTKTKSEGTVFQTHIEGDFFGGSTNSSDTWSNSESLRLRHAYGSLSKGSHVLLAGQTWSTFMDLAAGVPDMDIAGDPGFTFVRQAQVRYQYNLRPGHYIAAAIENPDRGLTSAGPPLVSNAGVAKDELPDFILKYFYANKLLTFSPRVIVRKFELTDSTTDESDTATAWGAALSSSIKAGSAVRFCVTLMYGDGLGRYGGLGNTAGAGLTADNKVETVGFQSINGGMTVKLSKTLNWTVGAGWAQNDDDAYSGSDAVLTGFATETAKGYHTNLKWKITPALEWAIGVAKYEREVMDGTEGDMVRCQSYFQWNY